MKYLRVVLAVEDKDLDEFGVELDGFIEDCDHVQGAYVSALYTTREDAWGDDWEDKK